MINGRVTKNTYGTLLSNTQARFNSWANKHLSMAGRVTLINSVLSAMPSYLMQTTMLPDNVIKEFEKFTRDFFGVDMRRNELVNWEAVCVPRHFGGLGLQRMELHNVVLLLKTAWRFLMEPQSLWVQFLKAKSRVGGDAIAYALSNDKSRVTWSYSWRCLVTAFRSFFGGLKRRIGDGPCVYLAITDERTSPRMDRIDRSVGIDLY